MSRRFTSLSNLVWLALIACSSEHPVSVEDAWVRMIQPSQSVTAGYLVMTNKGREGDRLMSVSTPALKSVEMHEMEVDENDVMRMRKSGPLAIGAGETVVLKSGGFHLMLIGPNYVIAAGNDIPLTLMFERSGALTITAHVREE